MSGRGPIHEPEVIWRTLLDPDGTSEPLNFPTDPKVGEVFLGWVWDGWRWALAPGSGRERRAELLGTVWEEVHGLLDSELDQLRRLVLALRVDDRPKRGRH